MRFFVKTAHFDPYPEQNIKKFVYVHYLLYLCTRINSKRTNMTYEQYIAQQEQAAEEEQQDDSCFSTNQPEGQFVRGH